MDWLKTIAAVMVVIWGAKEASTQTENFLQGGFIQTA
jgi:hypothetical protein